MVGTPKYELMQERLGDEPLEEILREYRQAGVPAPAIARLLANRTRVVVTATTIRSWLQAMAAA